MELIEMEIEIFQFWRNFNIAIASHLFGHCLSCLGTMISVQLPSFTAMFKSLGQIFTKIRRYQIYCWYSIVPDVQSWWWHHLMCEDLILTDDPVLWMEPSLTAKVAMSGIQWHEWLFYWHHIVTIHTALFSPTDDPFDMPGGVMGQILV